MTTFQAMVPVTRPAIREPPAHAIMITPAYCRIPASVANATTTTSIPPNSPPRHAQATHDRDQEPRRQRRGRLLALRGSPYRRLGAALGGEGHGPGEPEDDADGEPERRVDVVARSVTSTGPTMKTTSSTTASKAYAVFSSGPP